jgi:hypothetical protein
MYLAISEGYSSFPRKRLSGNWSLCRKEIEFVVPAQAGTQGYEFSIWYPHASSSCPESEDPGTADAATRASGLASAGATTEELA